MKDMFNEHIIYELNLVLDSGGQHPDLPSGTLKFIFKTSLKRFAGTSCAILGKAIHITSNLQNKHKVNSTEIH